MNKIAIISQTYLRDELLYKTCESIRNNWINNYILLIGDQNKKISDFTSKQMWQGYYATPDYYDNGFGVKTKCQNLYQLPEDCGLSYARNFLVQKAYEMKIPYCLISADSIEFTDKYNFDPIIEFIQERNNNAIVGLQLNNRQSFEYDMEIDKERGKFILSKPKRAKIIYKGIHYQQCDIVKNFFIAPTELLYKYKWLDELKLGEHEVFMNQLKENNVEVYYTNHIKANYVDEKPQEYKVMRNRLYSEYYQKMLKIMGMKDTKTGWIEYR